MSVSPIQKLWDACTEAFAFDDTNAVPSPQNIQKITVLLDDFKAADVGLHADLPHFRRTDSQGTPAITYLHLYGNDKFSMGIFYFPPSAAIPLHDHPGMIVFRKLLFGTMHKKSYDWVTDSVGNPLVVASTYQESLDELSAEALRLAIIARMSWEEEPDIKQPELRLAKVLVDSDLAAPCVTSILYPTTDRGEMQCFTAVTVCGVLDVRGPPYSDIDGQHFTYYADFPFAAFTADGIAVPEHERANYAWLQEVEKPEDVSVICDLYAAFPGIGNAAAADHTIQIEDRQPTSCVPKICSIIKQRRDQRRPVLELIQGLIVVFFGIFAIIAGYLLVIREIWADTKSKESAEVAAEFDS